MKKILLLLVIFLSFQCFAQNTTIDSLKQLLSTAREDTNKVWILSSLSENYTWSFADTAVIYAQQEIQLAQKLNFKIGEAYGMSDLASALITLGNYSAALNLSYKSLAIFKKLNDTLGIINTLATLGLCYRDQGDYKPAIQYLREDIRLRELKYHNNDSRFLGGMLSSVYERDNQLDSALLYAQKASSVRKDWSGLLVVLGAIHSKLGHNDLALNFYRKTIPLAIQGHVQIDILDAYNGIANVYLNEGKKDSAIYYAEQALTQKWGRVYPIGMLHASALLANIYESQNKTDSTLKYLKLTINLKDSLFNQQKTREAQSFAFNEQLHQQELQQQLSQSELRYSNRLSIYILLAGLLILLIVAGGLWRRNIFKQKSFALLHKQNEEIQSTLAQLKSTQAQLIQSEKMASLGELTAGIAHEIQNPLNFVNNFSEVNQEMIDELQTELKAGNIEEAIAISNNVKDNEGKINHHGRRADSIVKGMLQHSRASTGKKEPADINSLCDEYLRLSYHGMRAKDKTFNADFKTNFDNTIGKINIVPQDIGRVLLNLFNNAFYATNEKKKSADESYKPTVSIQTKKTNGKVEIKVIDNGNGMPHKLIDKIFQPFFTTKPTGQGTGLGLSLSYDIVKAHSGEIMVTSEEGAFTEFIVQLPVS